MFAVISLVTLLTMTAPSLENPDYLSHMEKKINWFLNHANTEGRQMYRRTALNLIPMLIDCLKKMRSKSSIFRNLLDTPE